MSKKDNLVGFSLFKCDVKMYTEEEILKLLEEERYDEVLLGFIRFIKHLVQKYSNYKYFDRDEFIQVGCLGLMKAMKTFNPCKNVKFLTYASRCAENEIYMHMRKFKKLPPLLVSIDEPISMGEKADDILRIEDCIEDTTDVEDDVIANDTYRFILQKIENIEKPKIRSVIRMYIVDRKTQIEIGEALDFSQSYVSRIIKKFLNELKEELNIN